MGRSYSVLIIQFNSNISIQIFIYPQIIDYTRHSFKIRCSFWSSQIVYFQLVSNIFFSNTVKWKICQNLNIKMTKIWGNNNQWLQVLCRYRSTHFLDMFTPELSASQSNNLHQQKLDTSSNCQQKVRVFHYATVLCLFITQWLTVLAFWCSISR